MKKTKKVKYVMCMYTFPCREQVSAGRRFVRPSPKGDPTSQLRPHDAHTQEIPIKAQQ